MDGFLSSIEFGFHNSEKTVLEETSSLLMTTSSNDCSNTAKKHRIKVKTVTRDKQRLIPDWFKLEIKPFLRSTVLLPQSSDNGISTTVQWCVFQPHGHLAGDV
ncbi:uncharacterized protein LOC141913238 [Tubulanus polymorphus]|uniref:uncharacterized protein LOC141913238 n=1 Tax=Tubulanus polymorphus TaxID=672921 RepID=UPI003DA5FBE5